MKWLAGLTGGIRRANVHLVDPDDPRLEGNWAIYDPATDNIYIDKTLAPDVRNEKLFHELEHFVNEVSGVNKLLENAVRAPRKRGDAVGEAFGELEENLTRARAAVWPRLLKDLGFVFPKGPTE